MIRKAEPEDMPALLKLERLCFRRNPYRKEQIEWFLASPRAIAFLSFRNDTAVGSMMLSLSGAQGRVVSLGVHPSWRGKGVAKELMEAAEDWFLKSGATEIVLEVKVDNQEAIRLYSSLGYQITRTLKSYYSKNEDAYLMRKELGKVG